MPRYTEDYSPFRALLGAPYPLPIYIARRVYPRQPTGQQYAPQQPAQNTIGSSQASSNAPPPPPAPGPPPPIPLPPCPPSPMPNGDAGRPPDPVATAAQVQGFPYDPAWRERPPATGPIPYPDRTPEQEADSAARSEIRLELRRYRRIAAVAGRVRVAATSAQTRDVVDAMAPVRNMQAVRRMQNMLNITSPTPPRHSRAVSAPNTPLLRANQTGPTHNPYTSDYISPSNRHPLRMRLDPPLQPPAVIVPREPNLSDLAAYYPPPLPFSDATADPDGGFRHWSDEEAGPGSAWETPPNGRRDSGQCGASPSSSNHPFTPNTDSRDSAKPPSPSSPPTIDTDLDLDLNLDGGNAIAGPSTNPDLQLTPDEAFAVKAITALVNTQVEQTATETVIRIPRSYHTRARMVAEAHGAAPNPIPLSPAAPSSISAASAAAGGNTASSHAAAGLNDPRVRIGFDPDVNSYVAVYDNHTLLISPATHQRLREVLGLEVEVEEPQYSPMAIDPRTADAMRPSAGVGNSSDNRHGGGFGPFGNGGIAPGPAPTPSRPAPPAHSASWPRPLPPRETGAFEPAPSAGMHLLARVSTARTADSAGYADPAADNASQRNISAGASTAPAEASAIRYYNPRPATNLAFAQLPAPLTASGLITRPTYATPINGLSRGLTLPSAPASRPPSFMPAAKACHNALLALRIVDWKKGAVTSHNYRLLGNALRERRRVQYAPEGEGWSPERVRRYLEGEGAGEFLAPRGQAGQGQSGGGDGGDATLSGLGVTQSAATANNDSVANAGHSVAGSATDFNDFNNVTDTTCNSATLRGTTHKRAREDSPSEGSAPEGTSAPRSVAEMMAAAGPSTYGSGAGSADGHIGTGTDTPGEADTRPALKRLRPRNRR